jgi:hypothetical protein
MNSMQPPPNVAKAVYFIEGDETASEYQSMVIEFKNERWLVATWLQVQATGMKYPDRIIPMSALPHLTQDNGMIRLGLLMPIELLHVEAPPEVLQRFGAKEYPSLAQLPGPKSTH